MKKTHCDACGEPMPEMAESICLVDLMAPQKVEYVPGQRVLVSKVGIEGKCPTPNVDICRDCILKAIRQCGT